MTRELKILFLIVIPFVSIFHFSSCEKDSSNPFIFSISEPWIQTNSGLTYDSLTNNSIVELVVSGNNIYAASLFRGVFRTTNFGSNWIGVNNGLEGNFVTQLEARDTLLLMGDINGAGAYVSTNSGMNWSRANNGLTTTNISALIMKGNVFFAGTWEGVFRSSDYGRNWVKVNTGLTDTDKVIVSFATNGVNIYAGTLRGSIYYSTNNGSNWNSITSNLPPNGGVRSIALSGNYLFAGTDSKGLFLSTDNGQIWKESLTNLNLQIVTSITLLGPNVIAGTSVGIFYSTNYGTTWSGIDSTLPPYTFVHEVVACGNYLFAGTETGVWRRPLN